MVDDVHSGLSDERVDVPSHTPLTYVPGVRRSLASSSSSLWQLRTNVVAPARLMTEQITAKEEELAEEEQDKKDPRGRRGGSTSRLMITSRNSPKKVAPIYILLTWLLEVSC